MSDRPVVRKSFSSPVILAVLTAVVGPTTHAQAQTPRHDLVAQCPRLANELPELLAGAKQEIRREAQLRVSLQIDTGGRLRIETIDGDRCYASAVRRALVGLRYADELPEAQRQVLTIRFEDPLSATTPSHYASR